MTVPVTKPMALPATKPSTISASVIHRFVAINPQLWTSWAATKAGAGRISGEVASEARCPPSRPPIPARAHWPKERLPAQPVSITREIPTRA